MNSAERRRALPAFVTEDYLALLRGAVLWAWGFAAAMALAWGWAWLRGWPWPALGGFDLAYTAVFAEFLLTTLALTALAARRDWFESVPRAALARVRTLVGAVLVWLGLHHLAAFHVTGGMGGPLLPALPLLVLLGFLALPRRGAWGAGLLLVAGHAVVAALERGHVLQYPPPLAPLFAGGSAAGHAVAYAVLALAFAAGVAARRRLDAAGASLHRSPRLDGWTGLYDPAFLVQRIGYELARQRRRSGPFAIAVVEVEGLPPIAGPRGYEASRQVLREAGQVLIACTRVDMDTPARLAPATFAILLPDVDSARAREVLDRIEVGLSRLSGGLRTRTALLDVAPGAGRGPAELLAAAAAALAAKAA